VELPFRLTLCLAGAGHSMPKECDDQSLPGRMRSMGNISWFSTASGTFCAGELQKDW